MNESDLADLFARLGAPDPAGWARAQAAEGVPQLARFLFLRQAWRQVVPAGDTAWITAERAHAAAAPEAPFAGTGLALDRLLAQGAQEADLTELVRGMQAQLLHSFCYLLSDPGELEPEVADMTWALVQLDDEGQVLGEIGALHESVLETDPTGREMRPGTDA